ncbi:hypothetical protein [Ferrovibrio sp.]|uniref:hypothetical protein n=1 Tax=Ferrovibrio sp. TaxID=1917215 RepID=UPI00311F2C7C
MKDLIERLEKASEGSRGLDALVGAAVGFDGWTPGEWRAYLAENAQALGAVAVPFGCPHFTTSLDAAMTLVREGLEYEISTLYSIARVSVGLNASYADGPWNGEHKEPRQVPLAFCIAAIKAEEALRAREPDNG